MNRRWNLLLASAVLAGGLGCTSPTAGPNTAYPTDTTPLEPGQQLAAAPGWHQDAVIYHIWVKAFADSLYNDGIGDLPGIEGRLDYLQNLGVNTLWLSPIFECAYKGDNMHGYDTTDFLAVNDRFGRKSDLKRLLDQAHGRGMRLLFDFVPNHTSTRHPWFTDPATSANWYVWKPSIPTGWGFPWGGGSSSEVWRYRDGNFFYTSFGVDSLADLNYTNPSVPAALEGVARYWLDRGFDGFRVDAARYLHETGPGQAADQPATHAQLKSFRRLLDGYSNAKVMIAEAWTNDASGVVPYFGNGSDEFHLCLDFSAPWAIHNAITGTDATKVTSLWEFEQQRFPAGGRSATFDSNHDNLISRPGTQYAGNKGQIILAEALNLLSPGTPIIYYGNEIGMTGQSGTDLNLRRPMDWSAATAQAGDPESILSWCKYLVRARTSYPALRGSYATLPTDAGPSTAIAYLRSAGTERILVVGNLTASPQSFKVTGLSTHGIPAGGPVQAILGDLKGAETLSGPDYPVNQLPPYGVRVIHAGGGAFQGTLHGDLK
jgi:alpha-glucosidase